MKVQDYKELVVWQKAKLLAIGIYRLTDDFSKSELFDLTSQVRRAAISIPSNIAEERKDLPDSTPGNLYNSYMFHWVLLRSWKHN